MISISKKISISKELRSVFFIAYFLVRIDEPTIKVESEKGKINIADPNVHFSHVTMARKKLDPQTFESINMAELMKDKWVIVLV